MRNLALSRTRNSEEVLVIPSSFCGFRVIESALFRPRISDAVADDNAKTPPIAASTCSQMSCCAQRSAMSSRGSTAPRTVVPAVATTAWHGIPRAFNDWTASARAAAQRAPFTSTGSCCSAYAGNPITMAAFCRETWASRLQRITPWSEPDADLATTRPIRLLRVPPLARTPPDSSGRPSLEQNQTHSCCSRLESPGDNSSANKLLFSPAQMRSAAIDAVRGGGSRWASDPGCDGW